MMNVLESGVKRIITRRKEKWLNQNLNQVKKFENKNEKGSFSQKEKERRKERQNILEKMKSRA